MIGLETVGSSKYLTMFQTLNGISYVSRAISPAVPSTSNLYRESQYSAYYPPATPEVQLQGGLSKAEGTLDEVLKVYPTTVSFLLLISHAG